MFQRKKNNKNGANGGTINTLNLSEKEQKPKKNQKVNESFSNVNRWWEKRARKVAKQERHVGRYPKFTNSDDLWEACCEYFEWMESRPQYEVRPFQHKGDVTLVNIPKKRPFTLTSLCLFLGITKWAWFQWTEKEDFKETCEMVEMVIYQQKFEGASVDLFNSNIIARDLGLRDKQEHSGPDGGPIQTESSKKVDISDLSEKELDMMVHALDRLSTKKEGQK